MSAALRPYQRNLLAGPVTSWLTQAESPGMKAYDLLEGLVEKQYGLTMLFGLSLESNPTAQALAAGVGQVMRQAGALGTGPMQTTQVPYTVLHHTYYISLQLPAGTSKSAREFAQEAAQEIVKGLKPRANVDLSF